MCVHLANTIMVSAMPSANRHTNTTSSDVSWSVCWPHPCRHVELRSYTGKVFSLIQTQFKEALLLDADSMPLQHPDFFFQHPEYLAHGSLFFPDAWTHAVRDEAFSTFGLDPGSTRVSPKPHLKV